MARSRKSTPSITYCPKRQRKWKNEQKRVLRKAIREYISKYDEENEDWLECNVPTIRSNCNLYNAPADLCRGESAMFPLRRWFSERMISDPWYRSCIRK